MFSPFVYGISVACVSDCTMHLCDTVFLLHVVQCFVFIKIESLSKKSIRLSAIKQNSKLERSAVFLLPFPSDAWPLRHGVVGGSLWKKSQFFLFEWLPTCGFRYSHTRTRTQSRPFRGICWSDALKWRVGGWNCWVMHKITCSILKKNSLLRDAMRWSSVLTVQFCSALSLVLVMFRTFWKSKNIVTRLKQ